MRLPLGSRSFANVMERVLFAAGCVLVLGFLAYLFVRSLKGDRERPAPKPLPDTVVAFGDVVVSYRADPERLDTFLFSGGEVGVSTKLREILHANPTAELSEFAGALGIIVTGVERYKRREETDGIVLGDE